MPGVRRAAMLNLNLWYPKSAQPPEHRQDNSLLAPRSACPLLRIAVLNTKGGCGKTTLATNLAGYYAAHGYRTALLDADAQASSMHWLQNRGGQHAFINAINGTDRSLRVTRSFQMRIPPGTERLIVDSPAALDAIRLREFGRGADAILIPVLPSEIDIHAASRCIADLLLAGHVKQRGERVAVIANRVKKNTLVYAKLQLFLESLGIPFVATLRDTQNYVRAAELGVSIHELDSDTARQDVCDWEALIAWLEQRAPQQIPAMAAAEIHALNQPAG
jgi:chromosome partitioning protein